MHKHFDIGSICQSFSPGKVSKRQSIGDFHYAEFNGTHREDSTNKTRFTRNADRK
jgi:hypothetical protein